MQNSLESLKHRVVCSDHFSDSAYMCAADRNTTSSLNWNAMPTIFSHSNPPKVVKERKPPAHRHTPAKKVTNLTNVSSTVEVDVPDVQVVVPDCKAKSDNRKVLLLKNRLQRKLQENRQLKVKLAKQEVALRKIKRNMPDNEHFKHKQRTFLNLQFRSAGLKRIRQYTAEEKDYAIALYHR